MYDNEKSERPRVLSFRVAEQEYEDLNLVAQVKETSIAEYLRARVNLPGIREEANRIRELARAG